VISERSGVVDIAMEGMMLTGAFFAVVATCVAQPWLDAGRHGRRRLDGLIHAVVAIRFRADQIVSGIAINIFAPAGPSSWSTGSTGSRTRHISPAEALPILTSPASTRSLIGQVFFKQNGHRYVALALLVLVHIVLFRTRLGLRIRAVGEHPQAAYTAASTSMRFAMERS